MHACYTSKGSWRRTALSFLYVSKSRILILLLSPGDRSNHRQIAKPFSLGKFVAVGYWKNTHAPRICMRCDHAICSKEEHPRRHRACTLAWVHQWVLARTAASPATPRRWRTAQHIQRPPRRRRLHPSSLCPATARELRKMDDALSLSLWFSAYQNVRS